MKRRALLLASSGLAGSGLVQTIRAAVPCPPPLVVAGGASVVSPTCPTSASGGGSVLAALAASMSSGQWSSFTMGGMGLSLLDAGGGRSITEYAARGHWDPVHKKIQFWGQGHYANSKLITWDDATNQWSQGTDPGWGGIGHAYYHLALDPRNGDLYLRQYYSERVKKKPYGGAWVDIASHHNSGGQVAGGLEWSSSLNGGAGGLVFCDTISAESWNPTSNSWTLRSSSLALGPYSNWIAAAAGQVYFGGGSGSSTMYSMSAGGAVSAAPSTPIQAGVGGGTVMRHPDGNQLLLFSQGATGAVYRFNGSSWVSHGSHQIGGATNYWFGVPISDYGVVLFVAQTGSTNPTVKVYKP
jgi:hypothetical protein